MICSERASTERCPMTLCLVAGRRVPTVTVSTWPRAVTEVERGVAAA